MNKENVKIFFEELEKNPALKEKFLCEMKDSDDVKRLISFAANAGFVFSEKDIVEFCDDARENSALADEDLANASGGSGGKYSTDDYRSSRITWRCYYKF